MKLWINDFDNNVTIEQIVTLQDNGGDYPIHQKKELTGQLVSLKKENLKASDYARRTMPELFSEFVLEQSIIKESTTSSSVIAINEGNGKFTIKSCRQERNSPVFVEFLVPMSMEMVILTLSWRVTTSNINHSFQGWMPTMEMFC